MNAQWDREVVADTLYRPIEVLAGEFMGDVGPDVIYCVRDDGYIWGEYDYEGNGVWSHNKISGQSGTCPQAVGICAGDIDTSGTLDVVGVSWTEDGFIAWWKYDGQQNEWALGDTIATNLSRPSNVAVADIDGDGDNDVAACLYGLGSTGSRLVWYKNNNGVGTSWTQYTIDSFEHPYTLAIGYLNLDTYLDVVATSTDLSELDNEGIYVYYGSSNQTFSDPPDTVYYNHNAPNGALLSPRSVEIALFDNNLRYDLIVAFTGDQDDSTSTQHGIAMAYAQPAGGNDVTWTGGLLMIDPDFSTCRDVFPVNLDNDGDMDFVATSLHAHLVDGFINTGESWDEFYIGRCKEGKGVATADFTGDGYMDVIAASYNNTENPDSGQAVYLFTSPGFELDSVIEEGVTLSAPSTVILDETFSYSYSYILAEESDAELYAWYKVVAPGLNVIMQTSIDTLGTEQDTYEGGGTISISSDTFSAGDVCQLFVTVGHAVYSEDDPPAMKLHGDATASVTFEVLDPQDFESFGDLLITPAALPSEFELGDLYPNPFNPATSFTVALPEMSLLKVNVYNITGQRVEAIAEGTFSAGWHRFTFDGHDLASGIYFLHAVVPGEFNQVHKLTLLR